jgi:hypothetical protein
MFKVGDRDFQLHQFSGSRWELLEYKFSDNSYPVLKKWYSTKKPERVLAEAIVMVLEETKRK